MTEKLKPIEDLLPDEEETSLQGVYGQYTITSKDKLEVKLYRFSVLLCGISFVAGISHWLLFGPSSAWIWIITMAISLGLSLKWIHIYLRPLHKTLQLFWILGCIGILIIIWNFGVENLISELSENRQLTLLIGPLFAALTGLGFKEFFCFRRLEAIGLTLILPLALLGNLSGILKDQYVMSMLAVSAFLLMVMALRKFGIDASADIGDKSVFQYLTQQTSKPDSL